MNNDLQINKNLKNSVCQDLCVPQAIYAFVNVFVKDLKLIEYSMSDKVYICGLNYAYSLLQTSKTRYKKAYSIKFPMAFECYKW